MCIHIYTPVCVYVYVYEHFTNFTNGPQIHSNRLKPNYILLCGIYYSITFSFCLPSLFSYILSLLMVETAVMLIGLIESTNVCLVFLVLMINNKYKLY